MAGHETNASTPESSNAATRDTKAPKDRQCPFCGQAFTSSSLGRHLDLYIKRKNPKPPDGVHDVDEIRKLRGGITRRQPKTSGARGSFGAGSQARREESNGATPSSGSGGHQNPARQAFRKAEGSPGVSPADGEGKNGAQTTQAGTFFNQANWLATGVINDLPPRAPSRGKEEASTGQAQRIHEMRQDASGQRVERPEYESESSMRKLEEAAELGRAAEMALREVLGSLEAAQKKVGPKVLFAEFDFFALSFPGLCLAILPPPSTLFSPAPFPSAESWTLIAPGQRQYETINRFLHERSIARRQHDSIPDSIIFKHHTHVGAAWEHWQTMSEPARTAAWNLEVLRSFARAQERNVQLSVELETSQQHARHLEAQYDRLSRCQLPREYLMHPPKTVPIPPAVMRNVEPGKFKSGTAADYDADALLTRWKTSIKATYRLPRATGNNHTHPPPPPPTTTTTTYLNYPAEANRHSNRLRNDMIMSGTVFGINGPMPRNEDPHVPGAANTQANSNVSYETPPEPGVVVGAEEDEDDEAIEEEEDADGEEEESGGGYGAYDGALMRRPRVGELGYEFMSNGGVNENGKRPAGVVNGTGENYVYKARVLGESGM